MVLLGVLWLSLLQSSHARAPLPTPDELGRGVRRGIQLDQRLQTEFMYVEHRRDIKVSKLGKVTVGPLRTFEVYPSDRPGEAYKRLIAVEGKPLRPEELARRDAEQERNLREAEARARRESAAERAERLEREAEEARNREAILHDAYAVFSATILGRETIDGRQVIVADLRPREDARVHTREGRWMKHFEGRLWVDERNYQVVKLEMQAVSDITIGWGFVGRLNEGSRLRVVRRLVQDVWLPHQTTYEASGRTLLFRPFQFSVTTTYTDYKRK